MKKLLIPILIVLTLVLTVGANAKCIGSCYDNDVVYTKSPHPVWISEYKPFGGVRIIVTNANDDYAAVGPMKHKFLDYPVFTGNRYILKNIDDCFGLKDIQDYTSCVDCS
jgi:hypothetical protein